MNRFVLSVALLALAFAPVARAADPVVEMKTSMGTIKIQLFEDKAPETVKNFLKYAEDKHYDGLTFHRVISDFMIQGGGYEKGLNRANNREEIERKQRKTRAAIKNESNNGLSNEKYTLAMARTSQPDSATSQFFINTSNNNRLDRANAPDRVGYCVFGKVIGGMDVVDKIKDVKTKALIPRQFEDVPVEEVVIESVKRVEK